MRLSYVGELGFELHHPIEYQRHIYEALSNAGEPFGLVDFGYRALDSMRLEKAYRLWGPDMSSQYTPLEAGMERFVRFDKGDFIGRDALLREQERGSTKRLCCLVVDAADADAHGYEPLFAEGRLVGAVTSGGYGHTLGSSLALAYVEPEYSTPGTELQVRILGEQRAARVVVEPPYDPQNARLRA
jgi:dimethylglycine dehydrogenase